MPVPQFCGRDTDYIFYCSLFYALGTAAASPKRSEGYSEVPDPIGKRPKNYTNNELTDYGEDTS